MKKGIYALILSLVVVSGVVFANHQLKTEPAKKPVAKPAEKPAVKPPTEAERKAAMAQWEATPEGIKYTKWKESPDGQKVMEGSDKINKYIKANAKTEAVVTSLTLPPGSRLGFGIMVNIDGEDYILRFDGDTKKLENLKVNDKLIIKSRVVSHAPKYAYPIIAAESVELNGKMLYKYLPPKDGC